MFKLRSTSMQPYQNTEPQFDIRSYFDGEVRAWGLIQNWRGQVQSRFDLHMRGEWEGKHGTLTEDFRYYSGVERRRVWQLVANDDRTFTGTASDIVGKAEGRQNGSAMNWNYTLRLPVNNKEFVVNLDDWMWHMNDGIIINRSYIRKFGFTVAELTVFLQKVDQGAQAWEREQQERRRA